MDEAIVFNLFGMINALVEIIEQVKAQPAVQRAIQLKSIITTFLKLKVV